MDNFLHKTKLMVSLRPCGLHKTKLTPTLPPYPDRPPPIPQSLVIEKLEQICNDMLHETNLMPDDLKGGTYSFFPFFMTAIAEQNMNYLLLKQLPYFS